jgi:hypothetical protein
MDLEEPYDIVNDAGYEAYSVDTTISEIMVNAETPTDSVVNLVATVKSLAGWIPHSE